MITLEETKTIIKHLCRDFDVPLVRVLLCPKNNRFYAEYIFNLKGISTIRFYGKIKLNYVLHELAHHIHQIKHGDTYPIRQGHNITFHRICFEVRDVFNSLYGVDVSEISSNYPNEGYFKALEEWANRRQTARSH